MDLVADADFIYLYGNFASTSITFDGAGLLTNGNPGTRDLFVTKLRESNGNLEWSQRIGGPTDDNAGGITVDSAIYITGAIDDGGSVVEFPGGVTRTTENSGQDIFFASLDTAAGLTIWTRVESNGPVTSTNSTGHEAVAGNDGNVYFTGAMNGTTDFSGTTLVASGTNIFVAAYNKLTGNVAWAKGVTGTGQDRGYGIDTLPTGGVYVGGRYGGTATFDTVPALPGNTGSNLWVGRLGIPRHTAIPDTFCVPYQTTVNFDVMANDLNPGLSTLTNSIKTPPTQGIAVLLNADSIQYTPDPGFFGLDSIYYIVCGPDNYCDSTWIHIEVIPLANAGPDNSICPGSYSLTGNDPFPGTGNWTQLAGTATITTPVLFNSPLTGVDNNLNTLVWEVSLGNCSSTDTLTLYPDTLPPVINTCPPDQYRIANPICQDTVLDYRDSTLASDNCGPAFLSLSQSIPPGTVLDAGTYPMEIYATDSSGYRDTCNFNLVIAADINVAVVGCGTSLVGESTIGAGNNESNFSCVGFSTPGQDRFYQITVPAGNFWIQVTMDNVVDANDRYAELFWIGGLCPLGGTCIRNVRYDTTTQSFTSTGTNLERFLAAGPGTYYLAIDSRTDGIDSYDLSFDCVASGIAFDQTGCPSDPGADGFNPLLNGNPAPLSVTACQRDTFCHQIFIENPTDFEWMDSLHLDLGACYSNVIPESRPGFFRPGNWVGTYNPGMNAIDWDFQHNPPFTTYGDGAGGNYNCLEYTFCFSAEIAPDCALDEDLNIALTVWDDGVGGAGATAASVDGVLSNQFTVTNPPPTLTCPASQIIATDSNACTAVPTGLDPSSIGDNCPGAALTYQLSGATVFSDSGSAQGSTLNAGITTITYTLHDIQGDSVTCSLNITVNDSTPPTLTCPANFTIFAPASCNGTLQDYTVAPAGLADNCSPNPSITLSQSPSPGTPLTGDTTVTLTAADQAGNIFSCNFIISLDLNLPGVSAGPDTAYCDTAFTLMGTPPAPGSGNWTLLSGIGSFGNPGLPNTSFAAIDSGFYEMSWTITNGNCTATDTVVIQVEKLIADAGPNDTICGTGYTLNGNPPPGGSVGEWSVVTGGGSIPNNSLPNAQVSNLNNGLNILQWKISNASCADSNEVYLTAYDSVFAITGPNDTLCGNSDSLFALPQSVTGTWSLTGGTGTIGNPTDDSTSVTGLSFGLNTFQWKVENGRCVDSTTVSLFAYEPVIALAGNPDSICGADGQLNATSPIVGAGSWTTTMGAGSFANANLATTTVSGLTSGVNQFRWTVVNGVCRDSAEVVIMAYDSVFAIAGPDDEVCGANGILSAVPPLAGSGIWTVTGGTAIVLNPKDTNAQVTGLSLGINPFLWTVTNGVCQDTASMHITSLGFPVADAGPTDSVYGLDYLLNAVLPPSLSGGWNVLLGSGIFSDPSSPNSTISGLSPGLNRLNWKINNGVCSDSSTVDIYAFEPVNAVLPADTTVCGDSITLTASSPLAGTGTWSNLGGTGLITDPTSLTTPVTGLGAGGNSFVWELANGPCMDRDTLFVTNASVSATGGGNLEICETDTAQLAGNDLEPGTWSIPTGSIEFSDPTLATSSVYDALPGLNVLIWTVDNGTCSAIDTVEVFAWALPTPADAGPDQVVSPGTPVNLSGNTPASGTGNWTQLSGPNALTILPSTDPTAIADGFTSGSVYILEWRIENGLCPPSSDQVRLETGTFVIPEVVTPKNDGKNDTWEIIGLENYGRAKVILMNRWGNIVFKTDDYRNDWAGTNMSGKTVTDDTYYYLLELPDRPEYTGVLVVKR